MIVGKLLKANMRNSVKFRQGSSSKVTSFALAVVTVILSTFSVNSAQLGQLPKGTPMPFWPTHEKCELLNEFSFGKKLAVTCSSCTELPTNMSSPEAVEELHMDTGNNIEILKNGSLIRSKLTSLVVLNLKNCKIRIVEPGAFSGSNSLWTIYLSNNLITVLNFDIFSDVPALSILSISDNPISIIQPNQALPNSLSLLRLDLSNCRLNTISANAFDNMEVLWMLNLSGNNLTHLDWRMLRNDTLLNLRDNPWHCDCHVNFLMETLKNMGHAQVYDNITCASAEIPKWKGYLWNQVPEADMMCLPEISKLVYLSHSGSQQPNEHGDWGAQDANATLEIGDDVYFTCEYSGYPKPEVRWFKDNQIVMRNMSKLANLGSIQSKLEFRNDSSSNKQRLENDQEIFRYKFKDVLAVPQIQVKDIGSYTCTVANNHVIAHKIITLPDIVIPKGEEEETILALWVWIFLGLFLATFIAVITVIAWLRRGKGEERGIIEEPSFGLREFDVKQSIPDLMSTLEYTTDASLI